MAVNFLTRIRILALSCRDICWGRHKCHNCVEQLLNALIFVRGTACYRDKFIGYSGLADRGNNLIFRDFLAVKVLFHYIVVLLSYSFHEFRMVLVGNFLHIIRNILDLHILAHFVIIDVCLHVNKVDDTPKSILFPYWQLNWHSIAFQAIFHHLHAVEEIGTHYVHLVDVCHARYAKLLSLAPYCLRLRLNAALCGKNGNRTIQHAEGALNFYCKVNMARRVNNVDAVAFPEACSRGRSNSDAALFLFRHPVHCSGAVMNFTHFVVDACVIQDTFSCCCFARVDMRRYTDITD